MAGQWAPGVNLTRPPVQGITKPSYHTGAFKCFILDSYVLLLFLMHSSRRHSAYVEGRGQFCSVALDTHLGRVSSKVTYIDSRGHAQSSWLQGTHFIDSAISPDLRYELS